MLAPTAVNAWLDAHEKTDLMRVDLDAKAREMKFEKISGIQTLNSSNTVENSCVTLTRQSPNFPQKSGFKSTNFLTVNSPQNTIIYNEKNYVSPKCPLE